MKKLLPLFILIAACGVFGQQSPPKGGKYNLIVKSRQNKPGSLEIYYRANSIRKFDNNVSVWLKFIPVRRADYIRNMKVSRDFAYMLIYATFDCTGKRVTFEAATGYSNSGGTVKLPHDYSRNREPVRPDSIGEQAFNYFCK